VIKHYGEPDLVQASARETSHSIEQLASEIRRVPSMFLPSNQALRSYSHKIEPDRAWPWCKRRVGRHRRTAAERTADSLRLVRHRARSTRVNRPRASI
jgi:hypothetical protein